MILRIEGRTDKHSVCTGKHPATNSRTEAQRMAANTPAGEVEKLLLSCVFRLLLSATKKRKTPSKSAITETGDRKEAPQPATEPPTQK